MKDPMSDIKLDVLELCNAAKEMLSATNHLWWSHNPDADIEGDPPTVEQAQERHSYAFSRLQKAEYYARRAIEK